MAGALSAAAALACLALHAAHRFFCAKLTARRASADTTRRGRGEEEVTAVRLGKELRSRWRSTSISFRRACAPARARASSSGRVIGLAYNAISERRRQRRGREYYEAIDILPIYDWRSARILACGSEDQVDAKRLVTGRESSGKSVFKSIGETPQVITFECAPGWAFYETPCLMAFVLVGGTRAGRAGSAETK